MVDDAVRLPGHLLVRQVAHERPGAVEVELIREQEMSQHRGQAPGPKSPATPDCRPTGPDWKTTPFCGAGS